MLVVEPLWGRVKKGFRYGYPLHSSTQVQQSQDAETAQILVLKKALDIPDHRALALLQAIPLATDSNTRTQANTKVWFVDRLAESAQ